MKKFCAVLSLSVAVCGVAAVPPEAKTFDVREFGAKADGVTFDTEAIQKALDACGRSGGGTVTFSPGTYLSKPLTLRTKSTVLLEEGATLLASPRQSDFLKDGGDWLKAKSGGDF